MASPKRQKRAGEVPNFSHPPDPTTKKYNKQEEIKRLYASAEEMARNITDGATISRLGLRQEELYLQKKTTVTEPCHP
jgi:hypothetical protein